MINAIRKGNTRNYLKLLQMKLLPRETANYVPKVAAARYVFRRMKKFGLRRNKTKLKFLEKVKSIRLYQSFNLRKMSNFVNVPLEIMAFLNPDLKRNYVRVNAKTGLKIYMPKIFQQTTVQNIRKMNKLKKRRSQRKKNQYFSYTVRRGDNLISIANRFLLKVSELKKINKLKSHRILLGQKLKILNRSNQVYIVKKGETLSRIATRLGTTLSKLVQTNSLKNSHIFPSQELIIPL